MNAMTAEDRGVTNRLQNGFARRTPRRSGGGWSKWVLSFVGFFGLAGVGYFAYARYYAGDGDDVGGRVLTTPVKKGDFLITVTEDGNVESAKNVELRCKVPGESVTILDIVTDGKHVEQDELLAQLDAYSTEEAVREQQILVAKAEAAKIKSSKDFSAAEIAVDEYGKGIFLQTLQQLEANITVAKQSLSSAENLLHYSRKMHRKGYVTQLDVESKEFAVEQAKLNLGVAETQKEVLEKYTKAKTMEGLISVRDSARAVMKSDEAAYQKEVAKLERLEKQLKECTIRAPQAGMVVWANDMSGGRGRSETPKIDLGASVKQNQVIFKLPDLKHMQVKTLVHETKVDQLRVGMRARVKIQDREFQGEIGSIANQPEPGNFFSGSGVKEYATVVKIDGEPEDLKPGMTAEVEILVDEKKGVLQIPVQCVVEIGSKFHAYVKTRKGIEVRDLVLGGTNDTMIEIVDGLKEGELVLLNPRADIPDATGEATEDEAIDVSKRFGAVHAKPEAGPAAAVPGAGPGGPGGGPGGGLRDGGPRDGGPRDGGPRDGAPGEGGGRRRGPGGPGEPGAGGPGGGFGGGQGGGFGGGGGQGGFGGGGQGGNRRPRTFKDMDTNGDGKITVEELPERMQSFFGNLDANGDGFVDEAEHKAMAERRRQGGGGGGGGGFGGGGPGGGPPGGGQ